MFTKRATLSVAAAVMLSVTSPVAARGDGGVPGLISLAGPPAITVTPSLVFAPNRLCDLVAGRGAFPHMVTVKGTGFPAGGSAAVTEHGTQVATATIGATGRFTAKYRALAEPAGTYTVVATSGAASASSTVTSSAYNCWKEVGLVGQALQWTWEGSAYDPGTTAVFRVGGVKLKGAKTDTAGHWRKNWMAVCPASGTLPVTVTATSGGVRQTTSAGTVNC